MKSRRSCTGKNATAWTYLRLTSLLVGTGSAIAATLYLLSPNSPLPSPAMCWAIFIGAWVSVSLAWRRHRPQLRAGSLAHTLFAFGIGAEVTVAMIALTGQITQPSRQEQDRQRHYLALKTAIQAQDLVGVQAALRFADARELLDTPSGWDRKMKTNVANPLQLAVTTDSLTIAAALLDRGASACPPDTYDSSTRYAQEPLTIAAAHGNVAMMRLLMHHGATVNDSNGNSGALWASVGSNQKEAVAFLLSHGVNPASGRPGEFDTDWPVLRLARSRGHDAIARLLLRAGAKEVKEESIRETNGNGPYR